MSPDRRDADPLFAPALRDWREQVRAANPGWSPRVVEWAAVALARSSVKWARGTR